MADQSGAPLPVTASVEQARRWVEAGDRVVLLVAPAQAGPPARLLAAAAGQVSLMVGEPDDPAALGAAAEMAAELGARSAERPARGAGR